MKKQLIALAIAGVTFGSVGAGAGVTRENFLVRDGNDLLALCSVEAGDPNAAAAIHFCHGFLLGIYETHKGLTGNARSKRFTCLPEPPPSRNEVASRYVLWARKNARDLSESAVDTVYRFAGVTWPCRKGGR
jgi:hypothetical protein